MEISREDALIGIPSRNRLLGGKTESWQPVDTGSHRPCHTTLPVPKHSHLQIRPHLAHIWKDDISFSLITNPHNFLTPPILCTSDLAVG